MNVRSIIIIFILVLLASCSKKITAPLSVNRYDKDIRIDYANFDNWAAHPSIKDFSDSLSKGISDMQPADSGVDIFFVHPTTYFDRNMIENDTVYPFSSVMWNASLNNDMVNHKTDETAILYQASIFNRAGRVFAPRYRQANYFAYFTSDTAGAVLAFNFAYRDVKQAFQYYLDHYNKGRPIVIASHSQGTTHAKRLLKEYFEDKPLMKQLVVAYLVGMPIETTYYKKIPVCATFDQTGCICSWRTVKEGYLTEFQKKEDFRVMITNPLSWDTLTTPIDRHNNKGAILKNYNKIIQNTTGGRIYDNVLWVNKPRIFGSFLSKQKNYHIGDFNLFYMSVRKNVEDRINEYKKLHNN